MKGMNMKKEINDFVFSNYKRSTIDSYEDVLMHPESEYREAELDFLVEQVYREGFSDGVKFMEWLKSD